jgi:hypothetical protein
VTLIVGVVNRDFVVLLADRRIINAATRQLISDSHGKMLGHPWAGGWASAGLAHVNGQSAIRWFKQVLQEHLQPGMDQHEALRELSKAVSEQALREPLMQQHALMFGGAAFLNEHGAEPFKVPVIFTVANNHRPSETGGPPVPRPPSGDFRSFAFAPESGEIAALDDCATFILPGLPPARQRIVLRSVNAWRRRAGELGPLRLGLLLSAAMDEVAREFDATGDAVIGPGRTMTIVERGGPVNFLMKQADANDDQLEVESFMVEGHVVVHRDRWVDQHGWSGVTIEWLEDVDTSAMHRMTDGMYATFEPNGPPLPEPPARLLMREH